MMTLVKQKIYTTMLDMPWKAYKASLYPYFSVTLTTRFEMKSRMATERHVST